MSVSVGELIARYGKFLIAFWVVIVCIMISPAIETLQDSELDISELNQSYMDTQEYFNKYFDDPDFDLSRMQILVISYNSEDGGRQLRGDSLLKPYTEYIAERFSKDEKWSNILDGENGVTRLTDEGDTNKGMILLGFKFPSTASEDTISDYTDELRSTIDKMTDDYMYELYEKERHFDVNLTGSQALSYDASSHLSLYIIIAVIATVIFAMFIMGVYFGSVVTSIVSVSSMGISAIVTLGLMKVLSSFMYVPLTLQFITLLMSVIVSFAHSILIISAFRNRIMLGMGNEEAFVRAQRRTMWIITTTTISAILCDIVMIIGGSSILLVLGITLIIGLAVTSIVSITVPLPMINLTKYKVFWTRTSDGNIKNRSIRKISKGFNCVMRKIAERSQDHSKKRTIVTVAIVVILCITSCIYIFNDQRTDDSYDLMAPFLVDDSKTGLDIMKSYGDGGLTEAYEVALEFKEPAAHLERDFSIAGTYVMGLYWYSDVQYKDVMTLSDTLYDKNHNNLSTIGTVVKWDVLVNDSVNAGCSDGSKIISYICSKLKEKDWTAGVAMEWELKTLSKYFSDDFIVYFCGPRIDYVVNESLGALGYHMNSQKVVVVDRFMIHVYTASNVTSVNAMKTTENINRNVSEFVKSTDDITGFRAAGTSAVCNDTVNELNSKVLVVFIIICILIFLAFAVVERNIEFTLVNFIPSVIGMLFSSMIASLAIKALNIGDVSILIVLSIPLICIITSAWFGCIQYAAWRKTDNIKEVSKLSNPIIVVTTAVLMVFCIILAIADVRFIRQLALAFGIIAIVEGFAVKVIVSPTLWSILKIGSMKNKG